ncbi:serine hydrolase [Mucilaginibacter agri]|uniref:Serine hydrolase n=1 Tax=Mucilaginibacter agri TaxID=2695265 RepID=A0A965ZII5_9SPHI|nr:serine hydrolase [Mucilaginibacter agri]NCD71315.1 serine hydrolase [Mucilaginibacter agri]
MKTLRHLSILFLSLSSCLTVYAQSTANKIHEVETNLVGVIQIEGEKPHTIQEQLVHYKAPGISIAVIQNYKIAWAKGYGWADEEQKIPVTEKTLFQAASISKSLNGVGVLKLVQDKKLDLYTDINTYLTSWKFPYDSLSKGKKITVANLLSHTAGLNVHGFNGYEQGKPLPTITEILDGKAPANSPRIRSMYAPGLKSEYSGGGIMISQMIVMDVTHHTYAEYMKQNVLQPLGMTSSTYEQPPFGIKPALLTTAYGPLEKPLTGKYHIYPEQAAAGLWTNPTDLAKYVIETQLAYEGKSAKVLNQQTTKLRLTPYLNKNAALGVFIDNLDSTKYFQHSGGNEGFRCIYYGSLEGGNGVVIMVNSDNGQIISEVINSVAKVYGFKGLYNSTIKKSAIVADADLQSLVGYYELAPKFILSITKEGNQLYAQASGQGKFRINPESQTKFYTVDFPSDFEFIKDNNGVVTSVVLLQNGQKHEAKRMKL